MVWGQCPHDRREQSVFPLLMLGQLILPRHLARLAGVTGKRLWAELGIRFVKVAEYKARGPGMAARFAQG